jgi:hypothetical protein
MISLVEYKVSQLTHTTSASSTESGSIADNMRIVLVIDIGNIKGLDEKFIFEEN